MGNATSSSAAPPFPADWVYGVNAEDAAAATATALRAVSALAPDEVLAARAPVAELQDTIWNVSWEDYKDHAASAVAADIGLNRLVYKCVPKLVSETEFWRCYFCHLHCAVAVAVAAGPVAAAAAPPALTLATLEAGDDGTSNAIIAAFDGHASFEALSASETKGILARDAEDDEKLAAGIQMAVKKGVCAASPPVEALRKIDVLGMSADAVAAEIVTCLADAPSKGCVLVLQGLSGTGKGTTVAKLAKLLPRSTCWSNGNIFRALTLLAVTKCEADGTPFGEAVLTPALLKQLIGCLSFGKFGGSSDFDVRIHGLGHDLLVSQVANTTLKEPRVSKNIPTVAKMTQGEVITFASAAAAQMGADGMNVLIEGRAATLDYVRTPHRFELTLSKPLIIGKRRAAQRMMGAALTPLKAGPPPAEPQVKAALEQALAAML